MSNDSANVLFGFLLGACFSFLLTMCGVSAYYRGYLQEAIDHGYGHYVVDQVTREVQFEWITPTPED